MPERSSTEAIGAEAGPEITISETFFAVGFEKSTFSRRSGVTVIVAAMMSPRPSRRAAARSERPTGMKATKIFRLPVLYFLLISSSNILNASYVMPRGAPLSMK